MVSFYEVSSPVVFALKIKQRVVIDGILDEPFWKDSVKVGQFLDIYDNSKLAEPQTYFQVVYDDEKVYFGITGIEPKISEIIREPFLRDSWPRGTSIEIFLDTNSDRSTYYQFATNLGCGIFDSYNKDTKWDGNWEIATKIYSDRWTMEVAVPFSDFNIENVEKGMRWGLNICRNREGGIQYSSSWAAVGGDFHNPGKFNTLIFGDFDSWMEAEKSNYRNLKEETLTFFKKHKVEGKRIEARLKRIDGLMKKLEATKVRNKKDIRQIIPVYKQMELIQRLSQDIKDEMKVIKLLNSSGEE
ncbi:MAG: hypothetical protein NC929_02375 [Candidatus Omnitrophica bacterium]|nr:hypothetical protein [Candidatus Omnitrophota bacterium]